jgi:hypothetical protein
MRRAFTIGPVTYRPGMPEPIVYLAHERPDVEVLWEASGARARSRMVRWVGGAELHQVQ